MEIEAQHTYTIYPVGVIRKTATDVRIEIFDAYKMALDGLADFSHIDVYYWFDQNDSPGKRKILKIHPRKDKNNPLTGVFATHSPVRPNLMGMTVCKIVSISDNQIFIDDIDAFNGSPVIDIKCHTQNALNEPVKTPDWANPHSH